MIYYLNFLIFFSLLLLLFYTSYPIFTHISPHQQSPLIHHQSTTQTTHKNNPISQITTQSHIIIITKQTTIKSMQKSPNNRNKTTNQFPHPQVIKKQYKSKSKIRRKLSIQLRSHTQDNTQQNDFYQVCYTPTAPISHNKMMDKGGDRDVEVNFSTRNSGKINGLFLGKRREKSGLEVAVGEIRKGFLRVSYRDKLEEIASLFIRVKELVKVHGYFYITFSMLKFNMTSTPKITPHIHPDTRSTKPLHPIKKPNKFESELECVQELKNIIRTILPTIDLGDIKTFNNIIAYIERLIKQLDERRRKIQSNKNNNSNKNRNQNQKKVSDMHVVEGRREKQQGRYGGGNRNMLDGGEHGSQYWGSNGQSGKQERSLSRDIVTKMGKRDSQKQRERERQRQREIRQFTLGVQDGKINGESNEDAMHKKQKMDQRIKETKSTLMQSFRSINSIQEKVKMQLQKSKQPQIIEDPRRQRKTSWISERKKQQQRISPNPKSNFSQNCPPTLTPTLIPLPSPNLFQLQLQPILQQAPSPSPNTNTNIVMRTSVSGRKLMSMSIEMQSQINNLFNGEDTPLSCLYPQHNQRRQVKNSMLSRVAEEFQDLF